MAVNGSHFNGEKAMARKQFIVDTYRDDAVEPNELHYLVNKFKVDHRIKGKYEALTLMLQLANRAPQNFAGPTPMERGWGDAVGDTGTTRSSLGQNDASARDGTA